MNGKSENLAIMRLNQEGLIIDNNPPLENVQRLRIFMDSVKCALPEEYNKIHFVYHFKEFAQTHPDFMSLYGRFTGFREYGINTIGISDTCFSDFDFKLVFLHELAHVLQDENDVDNYGLLRHGKAFMKILDNLIERYNDYTGENIINLDKGSYNEDSKGFYRVKLRY